MLYGFPHCTIYRISIHFAINQKDKFIHLSLASSLSYDEC
ncbi:hypothetical protein BACEGG_00395 [Bacteroides eggerthii DSM 20697]|nr:hypothetical protein BACEGG_00395 [Bacteroides eggerthii DSM 20697]